MLSYRVNLQSASIGTKQHI